MCVIEYHKSEFFQEKPDKFCSNCFGVKGSWSHCWECRNQTARWHSRRAVHYLERYEERSLLAVSLNVIHQNGDTLSYEEAKEVLGRFRKRFSNQHPTAGYMVVLDSSPKGRPHWHGVAVGVPEEDIKQAWSRACGDLNAWSKIGTIETTIKRTVEYAFKVNGIYKGKPVPVPRHSVKVVHDRNFFRVNKSVIQAEIKSERKGWERKATVWKPSEDQLLDDFELIITRYPKAIT